MPLDNLRQFIQAIDGIGELVRVTHPVRARLEIAEIADRCMKSPGGGPALLFEHVLLEDGGGAPIRSRSTCSAPCAACAWRSGVDDLDDIGARITELLDLKVPDGLLGKLAMLPKLAEIAKFPPRVKGGRAPCQEVMLRGDAVDLDRHPLPHHLARGRRARTSPCRW